MDEHTRIDPTGPSARWRPSRLTVALAGAGGFLVGVLLVAILGGTPTLTETTTQKVTITAAAPATGGTVITKTAVPELVGQRLDVAKRRLKDGQFDADVNGGGLFGVLKDSNWVVVAQDPPAGTQYQQGSRVQVGIKRG